MKTLEETTLENTQKKIYKLLTTHTGISLLDSGGEDGRHFQRNRKYTFEEFQLMKPATWDRDYGAVLNLFHYLSDRLIFDGDCETLNKYFDVWVSQDPEEREVFYLDTQRDWLDSLGVSHGKVWYSYNWDNALSQDVQGWDFNLNGQNYVLLQIHNGADARGGFTAPTVFKVVSEYWLHDSDSYNLDCEACKMYWNVIGSDVSDNNTGEFESRPSWELFDEGCPQCKGELIATMPEPIDW
jgi:hypothetical protein